MVAEPPVDVAKLDALIAEVTASGGAEIANTQPFLLRLTEALGLERPRLSVEDNSLNDYVFERWVTFKHPDGSTTNGRIDCYKRDCFVLEAKQSAKRRQVKPDPTQALLLPEDRSQLKLGTAKRGTRGWDQAMLAARNQAEQYARALPVQHGYPPFLLVVDVGHVIEVYADFSGQGKNYAQFPDGRSYRIAMADLRDAAVQDRLRKIWEDPHALDLTRISAAVTQDIAERLARIAKGLEGKHDPKDVAAFLMRCLFTMFAEDVGLLPDHAFRTLLEQTRDRPEQFVPAMEAFWRVMDEGGFDPRVMASLKRFNGSLFKDRRALPLDRDQIQELYVAASKDWSDVEPTIFGTLLERALDPRERSKLGAHYTPRAYVERLVVPTIIEPLRTAWDTVQAHADQLHKQGRDQPALDAVRRYHRELCTTRVLDPACGTGNFLYVALELMKRLEGEVLEAIADLGGVPDRYADYPDEAPEGAVGQKLVRTGGRFTVDPHQFFGLELNPRAVPIAELVLWIGYLKWQLKTAGIGSIAEPVLDAYGTIVERDAILAYDAEELVLDDQGRPVTRWDGLARKPHPVTGELVPDETVRTELYRYRNPRPADWPEAEYIVGNPPFIGGKDMRQELGDGYAEACWKARPHLPGGADFVMHFWDAAADRLTRKGTAKVPNPLRRFGFITTNSITQTFSRRVIERYLSAKEKLSLTFAVPDHPWLKASDKAAVRIAMTVADKGEHDGVLAEVERETGLNTDTPVVELAERTGKVRANLALGADLSAAKPLMANDLLCSPGVKLHGAGFIVTPAQAKALGLGTVPELDRHILDYRNGRDLTTRPRGVMVIDLYPLGIDDVRDRFPAVYQHVADTVKPERDSNREDFRRIHWWWFGRRHTDLREFLRDQKRYIATVETSKHRFFQFLDGRIRPDNMLVNVGVDNPSLLAVLSSRWNVHWALSTGGWLGVGNDPRYSKSRTFDPFPFPACVDPTLTPAKNPRAYALQNRLRELGERLDSFRKERLAQHGFLTMTALYNTLERVRELDAGCAVPALTDKERDIYRAGMIGVLKELHDEIDRLVLDAYGWSDLAPALVGKPGATTPSPHKSAEQEAAEEDLLGRLVALNRERAAEEKRGLVHWLRPDFQIPRLGAKIAPPAEQLESDLAIAAVADKKPAWPRDGLDQIRLVKDVLAKAAGPAGPDEIAVSFDGRVTQARKKRAGEVLATLAATGAIRATDTVPTRYFVPR